MKSTETDHSWLSSKSSEIENLSIVLKTLGFQLDEKQLHLSGERYLMTKEKLVLAGKHIASGEHVIIKASRHPNGIQEIVTEKRSRDLLNSLAFAKKVLVFPTEIYYGQHNDTTVWITSYITQDKVFVSHNLEEQFFLTLRTFEAQEAFHATTFEHFHSIKNTLPLLRGSDYIQKFESFKNKTNANFPDDPLQAALEKADTFLRSQKSIIDQYANHLVHQDFVPHNFRVKDHNVFLLDCSSVYFGNKYEGWARFLNYMVIHSPELEKLLVTYIRENRDPEEYLCLRLMRVYKVSELLEYYTRSLAKTRGDLHELTLTRIGFWKEVMLSLLANEPLPQEIVNQYKETRDTLRSPEEKERQREFAVA